MPMVTADNALGDTATVGQVTVMAKLDVLEHPLVSVTSMVKLDVPAPPDGVPEIAPLEFIDNPNGGPPLAIVKVYGLAPPDAVIVSLYAVPAVAAGSGLAEVMTGPWPTVSDAALDRT